MEGAPHPVPRTVEEVFSDFKGRRAGLIKALTNGFSLPLLSPPPFFVFLVSVIAESMLTHVVVLSQLCFIISGYFDVNF